MIRLVRGWAEYKQTHTLGGLTRPRSLTSNGLTHNKLFCWCLWATLEQFNTRIWFVLEWRQAQKHITAVLFHIKTESVSFVLDTEIFQDGQNSMEADNVIS